MSELRTMKLIELKQEGHDLIDELVSLGTSRSKVYGKLKKRLKRGEGREHFRHMHTVADAQTAVNALSEMVTFKRDALARGSMPARSKVTQKRKRLKEAILAQSEMQKALTGLAERNKRIERKKTLHWWLTRMSDRHGSVRWLLDHLRYTSYFDEIY